MRYTIYFELRRIVNKKLFQLKYECNEEDKVVK